MGDVVEIGCITRLDVPPDKCLNAAIGKLEGVVIVGYGKDGEEYFASSYAAGPETLWLLERAKLRLLRTVDELSGG